MHRRQTSLRLGEILKAAYILSVEVRLRADYACRLIIVIFHLQFFVASFSTLNGLQLLGLSWWDNAEQQTAIQLLHNRLLK